MGNTTRFSASLGSGYSAALGVWGRDGSGNAQPAKGIWVYNSGAWVGKYSVIAASGSNVSNTSASGASTSGTATTGTPGLSASGNIGTLSYSWANTGGDGSFTCSNSAIANPTFSRAFTGVSNGTTSSTLTCNWRCTITDGDTGATKTVDITASAAWTNTIPAYGSFTIAAADYGGSGSGFSSSFPWSGSSTASVGSGGPTSGDFSFAWTYVSGGSYSHSGDSTATLTISHTGTCPAASSVTDSTTWNVHMVDNVSGFSADKHVNFSYDYSNNSG